MTSQMNKVSAAHFNPALPPSPHLSYYFLWPREESAAGFDFPPFAASLPLFLIIEPNFLLWAFFIWYLMRFIRNILGSWCPKTLMAVKWKEKRAERLFHFEGYFLPGHGGSLLEMLLSVSAINCLLNGSMANSGLEWEGELKCQKKCKNSFLMYAKACSGGVTTVSTDWICLLQHFILLSLEQRSWLLLPISNWVDLCHFPFSVLFYSLLLHLLSTLHFYLLIARPAWCNQRGFSAAASSAGSDYLMLIVDLSLVVLMILLQM